MNKTDPKKAPPLQLAAPHHVDSPSYDVMQEPRPRTARNDVAAIMSSRAGTNKASPRFDPGTGGPTTHSRRRTTIQENLSQAGLLHCDDTESNSQLIQKMMCNTNLDGKVSKKSSAATNVVMMNPLNTTPGAVAIPGIMTTNSVTTTTTTEQRQLEQSNTILLPAAIQIETLDDDDEKIRHPLTSPSMVDRLGEKIKQEVQAQLAAQHHAPYVLAEAVVQKSTRMSNQSSASSPRNLDHQEQSWKSMGTRSWRMISVIVGLVILAGIVTGVVLSLPNKDNKSTVVVDSPTLGTTTAPNLTQHAQEWLQTLKTWIAPTDDDQLAFQDGTSPQSLALEWLTTDAISHDLNQSSFPSTAIHLVLERYALAVLYFATKGPEWNLRNNVIYLNETSPSCSWNNAIAWDDGIYSGGEALGVYCSGENATVKHLALQRVGLDGSLPWELSLLSDLVTMQLNNNALRGTLPNNLHQLSSLKYLILSSTSLTGRVPDILPSSLVRVDLSTNDISGKIPSSIGSQLFNLVYLYVEKNNLSGQLPSELGHATMMVDFRINNNVFTGTIPTEFAQLTKLQSFSFEKNLLTGSADFGLCTSNRQWTNLRGDCLLDEEGQVEIECTCCTTCE